MSSSGEEGDGRFSILGLRTHFNPSGWGPRNGEQLPAFGNMSYAHFDKKERTWRAADFSLQTQQYQAYQAAKSSYSNQRFNRRDEYSVSNADFVYKHDTVEDQSFQLVDTSKSQNKRFGPGEL